MSHLIEALKVQQTVGERREGTFFPGESDSRTGDSLAREVRSAHAKIMEVTVKPYTRTIDENGHVSYHQQVDGERQIAIQPK